MVRPCARCAIASLHLALGFGIERGGGFVEQDDRRILDQRARDRDALALAAGQLQAVLADRRVVAEREAHDEVVGVGRFGGGDDLGLARAGRPNAMFSRIDAAEQKHVLSDIGDLPAQRRARHRRDVLAVDGDRAAHRPRRSASIRLRIVDLPPPEGPTSAVTLPGSATN